MKIRLDKTSKIIEDFEKIIEQNPDKRDFLLYFTEYVLIRLYAEIEEKLIEIIGYFLTENSNENLSNFLQNNLDTIFRRIDKKDMKKTLKMFEKEKLFENNLKEEEIQKYQNFITNRHNVAHSHKDISVSWQELGEIAKISEKIINNFANCLES